jgi:hypothetical protein
MQSTNRYYYDYHFADEEAEAQRIKQQVISTACYIAG